MRRLTFRPGLTVKGRKFKGLRGYAGKPFHPPLTDVPVTAYLFAAAFDILSIATHSGHHALARQFYVAGTWTLLGGAAVSLLAALTGWADWHRSSEPGTQARLGFEEPVKARLAARRGPVAFEDGSSGAWRAPCDRVAPAFHALACLPPAQRTGDVADSFHAGRQQVCPAPHAVAIDEVVAIGVLHQLLSA